MPISREAFDKGLSAFEDSIIDFLNKNSHNAYTMEELADTVGADMSSLLGPLTFSLRLSSLLGRGLIRSKIIGGITYYTSAKTGS